jgi:hypothetical protein
MIDAILIRLGSMTRRPNRLSGDQLKLSVYAHIWKQRAFAQETIDDTFGRDLENAVTLVIGFPMLKSRRNKARALLFHKKGNWEMAQIRPACTGSRPHSSLDRDNRRKHHRQHSRATLGLGTTVSLNLPKST